jgi:hypothetical protein
MLLFASLTLLGAGALYPEFAFYILFVMCGIAIAAPFVKDKP